MRRLYLAIFARAVDKDVNIWCATPDANACCHCKPLQYPSKNWLMQLESKTSMSFGLNKSRALLSTAGSNNGPWQMENGRQLLPETVPDSHATCAKYVLNTEILFRKISSAAWCALGGTWQHQDQLHLVTMAHRATVPPASSPEISGDQSQSHQDGFGSSLQHSQAVGKSLAPSLAFRCASTPNLIALLRPTFGHVQCDAEDPYTSLETAPPLTEGRRGIILTSMPSRFGRCYMRLHRT